MYSSVVWRSLVTVLLPVSERFQFNAKHPDGPSCFIALMWVAVSMFVYNFSLFSGKYWL